MVSIIIVVLSLITNVVIFYLMFNSIYIPNVKIPILIAVITLIAYLLAGYLFGEHRSKRLNRLLTLSLSLNIPYMLSSLTYYHWKIDHIIKSITMMKFSLIVLVSVILYLNFVYIRAEISYKRKRGNQRIQKEPKKSIFEKWCEERKRKENNEIEIILGYSTESEEKVPPI